MEINLSPPLRQLMKKSNWFGYLIYAPSLTHLEHKWDECKKLEKEFETLRYHEQFYELTKKRLLRDNASILELKSFENSSKLFKKMSMLRTKNKTNNKVRSKTHLAKTKTRTTTKSKLNKLHKLIRK